MMIAAVVFCLVEAYLKAVAVAIVVDTNRGGVAKVGEVGAGFLCVNGGSSAGRLLFDVIGCCCDRLGGCIAVTVVAA